MRRLLACAVLLLPLPAQRRLIVPEPGALEAARDATARELADLLLAGVPAGEAAPRLLAHAERVELTAAVRWGLAEQAAVCARRARDVAMVVRVAEWRAAHFALDVATARIDAVRSLEREGGTPPQLMAAAWLGEASRLLEGEVGAFDGVLAAASAQPDDPPGLAVIVAARARDLRAQRAAFQRLRAAPDDSTALGRYRAFFLGDFAAGMPGLRWGDDRAARLARNKLRSGAEDAARDLRAEIMAAENWLSLALEQDAPVVRTTLRRRALALLNEVVVATFPRTDGEELDLPEPERRRVLGLIDRCEAVLASDGGAFVQEFRGADDIARLRISAGEWRVEDGCLHGRSTGAATRATLPWAFASIASVTIRGRITSADNLNFRLAVGPCNVLFNWEVDDLNPTWFGDVEARVGPRALPVGREAVIRVRQLGDWIGVFVDDRLVTLGEGRLDGTVCVYPALGSAIAVRGIEVVGDIDLARVVTGPVGTVR